MALMRSDDPIADYYMNQREEEEYEKKCPVCDVCGERITGDFYYSVGGLKFHLDCAECHSVESYVEANNEF